MKTLHVFGLAALAVIFVAASGAVPISHLSLAERQHSSPDSTLVTLGKKTVTLALLRRAHEARERFVLRAGAAGNEIRHQWQPKNAALPKSTVTITPQLPTSSPTREPVKVGGVHPVNFSTPTPISLNLSGLGQALANTVLEPQSQYESTPADMKAFCLNAWAAACLYLPPQQPAIQTLNGELLATDTLIDQGQCNSEGGRWGTYYGNATGCGFLYPNSVTVHFTPASNFKLRSNGQCDSSWWTFIVDPHGAVRIGMTTQAIENIPMVGVWGYAGPSTGGSPWCLVYVTKG